jgi:transposase-like protein
MSIFKHLSDALRFRCNRHNAKGSNRCAHKVNIPLPGKDSINVVVDPSHIRLIEGKVNTTFHWNKMKFSSTTLSLSLYFSFFHAMTASAISVAMLHVFNVKVSHDTITRWSHKAAFLLAAKCNSTLSVCPKKRGRKPRILADETQFKRRGTKRWLWISYVPRYDFYLGHNLSARRNTQAARDLFAMTYHKAPEMKTSPILTDGLWSYKSALGDLNIAESKHIVYKSFFEYPNNNALERKWSNFKTRARPFRGFKSDIGLAAFALSHIVYHDFFKPSPKLKGTIPAEALGTKLPHAPTQWMKLARFLTI